MLKNYDEYLYDIFSKKVSDAWQSSPWYHDNSTSWCMIEGEDNSIQIAVAWANEFGYLDEPKLIKSWKMKG